MTRPTAGNGVPEFHLGDRLEKALRESGVTHQQMADYLGVSRNTVGNYIAMRTAVSKGTLRLWALRTGVSMQWLATGECPKPRAASRARLILDQRRGGLTSQLA